MQDDRFEVRRVAACGDLVELTLPAWLGPFRWYGTTRLTGPGPARQFFLAPAGEHRSVPSRLLPGARETRHALHGIGAPVGAHIGKQLRGAAGQQMPEQH